MIVRATEPMIADDRCELPASGERIVCSWSGGKDSCLALHRAVTAGAIPTRLLTMCVAIGGRTRNHGLADAVIHAQAAAMGIACVTAAAEWVDYREVMIDTLRALRIGDRCAGAVFGDIDIEAHRRWERDTCAAAGLGAYLPLWRMDRRAVIDEFIDAGFVARIVAVREGVLDPSLLGRELNHATVEAIEAAGADACGENGEYHSVVVDGPLFDHRVELTPGRRVLMSGVWFQDFAVADDGGAP